MCSGWKAHLPRVGVLGRRAVFSCLLCPGCMAGTRSLGNAARFQGEPRARQLGWSVLQHAVTPLVPRLCMEWGSFFPVRPQILQHC